METYPANLRYVVNTLSGFSRMRTKQTLNFATAKAGDVIFFKLPSNAMIDLSTLGLHGKITTSANSCPPQYIQSLIESLSVDVNGVNVQTINQYHQLYKLLANYQAGDQSLRHGFLELAGLYVDPPTGTTSFTNIDFACKQWLGLLGSGKIIDTSVLGEITVTLRLASNNVLLTAGTYELSSLSVQFDVVSMDNQLYQQSLYRQLENGGIKFGFNNYVCAIGGASNSAAHTQTFSVSSQSVDYLISTLLLGNHNSATGNTHVAATGTSNFFTHGNANVSNGQFMIGSVMYPSFPASPAEILALNMDGMALTYDVLGRSCDGFRPIPKSGALGAGAQTTLLGNFVNGNFAMIARLCHGAKSADSHLISGLSTSGTNTQFQVTFNLSAAANLMPISWAQLSSTLTIGAGRQIALTM